MSKGRIFIINNKEYKVLAISNCDEKVIRCDDILGVKIGLTVKDIETGTYLDWQELKGSYLAQKIGDYIENCFNGQDSFYWDWSKEGGIK
ncbi:MAG: hypothetical protein ACRCVJ_11775 [Clostridium sp.]|uniref:hypothetical protein n=1 Tax=Clostridium sp. TaxID=1506 RepID=UPI003F33FA6F